MVRFRASVLIGLTFSLSRVINSSYESESGISHNVLSRSLKVLPGGDVPAALVRFPKGHQREVEQQLANQQACRTPPSLGARFECLPLPTFQHSLRRLDVQVSVIS